jgi:hypothetical protein
MQASTPEPVYPVNSPRPTVDSPGMGSASYINWPAVFAGTFVAAGVSLVLITFGTALGLSLSTSAPSWRNASIGLSLLSGIWFLVVTVGAMLLGGYVTGRLRARFSAATSDEVEFRDGIHGVVMWGLAVLIGALLALATSRALAPVANDRDNTASQTTGEPSNVAYEVDRLFRTDRRPPADASDQQMRAEAGRLVGAAIGRRFSPDDHNYLTRLVAARTALAQPDAERRVQDVLNDARTRADRARRAAVVLAFMSAASLLIGAAAAWFAAEAGGRHRDGGAVPSLLFRRPRMKVEMR